MYVYRAMITFNGYTINQDHFRDGALKILDFPFEAIISQNFILWEYEDDSELFTLYCLVKHARNIVSNAKIDLFLPYIPHARMDRTKSYSEIFTLKYFSEVINSLNFQNVFVFDPHSNVSVALLNNVKTTDAKKFIEYAINDIEGHDIDGGERFGGTTVIYFPDEGAMRRYRDLGIFGDRPIIYGVKQRNWKTGEIVGLKIFNSDGKELESLKRYDHLGFVTVLMIDDIISRGETISLSTSKLKELGGNCFYVYASHIEKGVFDEKSDFTEYVNSGTIDEVFTTESLLQTKRDRLTIMDNNWPDDGEILEKY